MASSEITYVPTIKTVSEKHNMPSSMSSCSIEEQHVISDKASSYKWITHLSDSIENIDLLRNKTSGTLIS